MSLHIPAGRKWAPKPERAMASNAGHWPRQLHAFCAALMGHSCQHPVPIGLKGMAKLHESPTTNMLHPKNTQLLKIVGKYAVVPLTGNYVRLKFGQGMATSDKHSVSQRDVPLTSLAGVALDRSEFLSGTFRLILVGDTASPRAASVDINTVLTPLRGSRVKEWEEFTMAVHAALTEAGPKIPMSEQPLTASTPDFRLNDSTYLGG